MFIENKEDKVFVPQTKNTITASDYNQIKNEIQNAIELAGMEPEKDVIQFPAALKKLTEQSGAQERAKIEEAGTAQVSAVNTAGVAQLEAVNTAGAGQVAAVNTAGIEQISAVQVASAAQVQAARDWASKTDGPVADDEYSAKKYAQDAANNAALAGDKAQTDLSNVLINSGEKSFGIRPDRTGYLDILNNQTNSGLSVGPDGTPTFKSNHTRYSLLSAGDVKDYIIETGLSGRQWYRKYKSGWVEQGGYWEADGYGGTVTYSVPFADVNYCLLRTNNSENAGGPQIRTLCVAGVSATGFYVNNAQLATSGAYWYACGQGAKL